jgi:hypothetical protein
MSFSEEPRFRISAKQTAKNFWQLDGTVEYKSDKIQMSTDPNDSGNTAYTTLGLQLLSLIKETEKEFRQDGRKIVGDEDKK